LIKEVANLREMRKIIRDATRKVKARQERTEM